MSDDTPEVHDQIVKAGPITKAELAEDLSFMSPDEIFVAVEKLEDAGAIERRNDYERYRTSEDVFIALEDTLGHELDPPPVPEPADSTVSTADVFDDHSPPEIRLDKDNNRILLDDDGWRTTYRCGRCQRKRNIDRRASENQQLTQWST